MRRVFGHAQLDGLGDRLLLGRVGLLGVGVAQLLERLVARRAKRDAPDAGGWNAFLTAWVAADVMNPVSTAYLNSSCDKALFGWPCDAELEKLRDDFAREADPAKQKAIAEAVQLRIIDYPTHAVLGQFTTPTAIRTNVNGLLLNVPALALWNVEKK